MFFDIIAICFLYYKNSNLFRIFIFDLIFIFFFNIPLVHESVQQSG